MIPMRKAGITLLSLLILSIIVSRVSAIPIVTWPGDWSEAAAYIDSTGEGEVKDPSEDMTICYVLKTDTFLYFRAVFLGAPPPERELDIYLDTVAGGQTGTDKGHSLHGLAPDYKVFYGSAPASLYKWTGAIWEFVDSLPYQTPDSYSVEIAVALAEIGDPVFPIGILFISSTEADLTDWNSNIGYLQYPRIVGGTVYPAQTTLLALGAALTVLPIALLLGFKRKRP